MILFLQMCELCEQQTTGMMTDSNKSGDDLLEFPGSNQTIKLTISNQELFYTRVFPDDWYISSATSFMTFIV